MCVHLNLVFRWRATRPCFSRQHTLNINSSRDIFILVNLCHVCYRASLAPGNLLQSRDLLCLLAPHLLLPLLSLSDFPSEGSGRRRHPTDSTRQKPGPEGRSSKGLHRRRAVFAAAWSLHRLPGVSIIITYGLLLLLFMTLHMWDCSLRVCIALFDYRCLIRLSLTSSKLSSDKDLNKTNAQRAAGWEKYSNCQNQ